MPLSGLELLAAEIGIHILDLSALTEIQCGWTACAILASQPSCVNSLVSRRQSSYLYCVASRYGRSPYLDEALRCVAIRAKRVLSPSSYQIIDRPESLQYGTALQSLQTAIDDAEERNQPDVLCAINLLSLFEVCGSNNSFSQALMAYFLSSFSILRIKRPGHFTSLAHPASFVQEGQQASCRT